MPWQRSNSSHLSHFHRHHDADRFSIAIQGRLFLLADAVDQIDRSIQHFRTDGTGPFQAFSHDAFVLGPLKQLMRAAQVGDVVTTECENPCR